MPTPPSEASTSGGTFVGPPSSSPVSASPLDFFFFFFFDASDSLSASALSLGPAATISGLGSFASLDFFALDSGSAADSPPPASGAFSSSSGATATGGFGFFEPDG